MNIEEVKEEAKKIIELFTKLKEPNKIKRYRMSPSNAKQCALIYCDGMIELLHHSSIKGEALNWDALDDFWQQVKEHIKNNY